MTNSTLGIIKVRKRGLLLASSLLSVMMYAQTETEARKIRSLSNTAETVNFQKIKEKETPSPQELMAKAKQMNIKYSDEYNGKMFQLVGFDEKGMPLYYETTNAGAAAGTGADVLNDLSGPYKLDGEGVNVFEWDGGGVRVAHQEFGGRAKQMDSPLSTSDHATHVAGTLIAAGVDKKAKGMAYKANLKAYDWTSDLTEMAAAAANNAMLMSNHSYGFTGGFSYGSSSGNTGWHWMGDDSETEFIGFGQYRTTDGDWDFLLTQNPYYLPVKAAGNPRGDGPAPGGLHYVRILENGKYVWKTSTKVRQVNGGVDGFDTVNQGATSKNTLIVAAAEKLPYGYRNPQDVKIASFSAFGPTDDGRIKPDITGIGVDLYSTNSTGNADYFSISGTSMASPNVTGNIALLQQHFNRLNASFMKSATTRALVIHTAKEAGDAPGPDYKHGWGLLDSKKAAEVISVRNKYSLLREETLENGSLKEIDLVASGNEPLKVTIAWTDPRPAVLSSPSVLDDPAKMLVNDLDIKITDGTNEYRPWVLDPANPAVPATTGDNVRDNVEQIVINNPTPGATYKLVVSHKGILKKNELGTLNTVKLVDAASQDFSLVASGIKKDVQKDLAVSEVKVLAESTEYSTKTPVQISFANVGALPVQEANIITTLKNKASGEVLATITSPVANLAAGEKQTLTIELDLSKPFIAYEIQVKAEFANDEVEVNNYANTSAYTTVVDLIPQGTMHTFGFEDDFILNGWTSEDIDGNGRTWYKYNGASFAKNGGSFAINFANLAKGSNDWLFSNPLRLKANTKYLISFHTSKLRDVAEPLQVFFGKEAKSAAMLTAVSPVIKAETTYKQYIYEVTPTEDGVYHFGFQQKVDPNVQSYAVFVDDIVVKRAEDKPAAAFTASKTNPTSFENIILNNETVVSPSLATNYSWTVAPATFEYITGNANTASPTIKFNAEGVYAVTLKATNSFGSDELTKTSYITVKNTATTAGFSANKTYLFEGEQVAFSNSSAGNPAPTSYVWNITPSTGFTYAEGSSSTSKNPTVVFNKKGVYTVSLTAKSLMNEDTVEKKDYITVDSYNSPVRNLSHVFDSSTKDVKLTWVRPDMLNNYFESFENAGAFTPGYTFYDENKDGKNWVVRANTVSGGLSYIYSKTGTYGMVSYSYSGGLAIDADNWMITDKLKKGSEILKFSAYAPFPEDVEVYVVPAPASGSAPTLDEVKAGHKVLDQTFENENFEDVTVNIKSKTGSDFFLAFYHKTKKEADAWYLAVDDITLGYDNSLPATGGASKNAKKVVEQLNETKAEMKKVKEGITLSADEKFVQNSQNSQPVTFAATKYPELLGYDVKKNDVTVQEIRDISTTVATDNVNGAQGQVKYDVYAVYSDGKTSVPQTVIVDLTTLAADDIKVDKAGLVVYPNPSSGLFIIDGGASVTALDAKVYDMGGKLILDKKSKERKLDLDLTRFGKGVYILNAVDQNGRRVSVKLIVK